MPVFLPYSPLLSSSSRPPSLPRLHPPVSIVSFTAYENVRRRIEHCAACIMERASNDSAGKIADTRDGRDLQPDHLPLHLSSHVEQCFPICYVATEFLGIRHRARNCVHLEGRDIFLSFLIPFPRDSCTRIAWASIDPNMYIIFLRSIQMYIIFLRLDPHIYIETTLKCRASSFKNWSLG